MKLGVITNGISYDLETALKTMKTHGLTQVELQYIGNKADGEIGNQSEEEIYAIKDLIDKYQMQVCALSRHLFQTPGVMNIEVESQQYQHYMSHLKTLVKYAKILSAPLVRTMSFSKTMIIHGADGADEWNAGNNASWPKLLTLMEKPVEYAELNDITLVVETGNNAMVTSCYLAKKLIQDLGSRHLQLLWDPANSLFCADIAYPEGYEQIKDVLGHIHIKDVRVDIPRAEVACCPLGQGDMGPYLEPLARALRTDDYKGSISLESVYRPKGGTYADGFKASIDVFKKLFE